MSIKSKVLYIGSGQAGGNLGQELENRGYRVLVTNTSKEDLATLTVKQKYHISGGEGCSKDRSIGGGLIKADAKNLFPVIENCCEGVDIIFVGFACGGGTGSSEGPVLADMLTLHPAFRDKIICMVAILPSEKESIQANANAYACFRDISTVENTGACFILDNNEWADKKEINKQFVDFLDEFLNIPMSDKSTLGNIDLSEIKKTLSAHNMAVMTSIPKAENTVAEILNSLQNNSIFAPRENDNVIQYTALSLCDETLNSDEVNKELQKNVGKPIDSFTTFNKRDRNFICMSGLSYPAKRLQEIAEIINKDKDVIIGNKAAKLELNADLSFLKTTKDKPKTEKTLENIWDKYSF